MPGGEGSDDSGNQVSTVTVTDLVMENKDLTQQLDGIKVYIGTLEHQVQVASCETHQLEQQLEEKTVEKDQEVAKREDKITSLKYQLYAQSCSAQVKPETQADPPAPESKRCRHKPQINNTEA